MGPRELDLLRLLWLSLPLTVGPAVQAGLDPRSTAVATLAVVGCWLAWAGTLLALSVPRIVSLTVLRVAAPAVLVVAVLAAGSDDVSGVDGLGLAVAALVLVVAAWPGVAAALVDGSSYGPERRLPLRTPPAVAFVVGPLAVAVILGGISVGPLLLAAQQWALGGLLTLVGVGMALLSARSLHELSRRFLVFVPGGVVVHDPMTVVEPVLFARTALVRVGPAPEDTGALDLTMGAGGLIMELHLDGPTDLLRRKPGRRPDQALHAAAVLIAPTRPAVFLTESRDRRLPVKA